MTRRPSALTLIAPLTLALAACDAGEAPPDLDAPEVAAALAAIEAEAIEHHIGVLAHDSMAGRAPGTPGFEASALYAERFLAELGLQPAGRSGTFRQPVPLRSSVVVEGESSMSIGYGDRIRHLDYGDDFYLGADPMRTEVAIEDAPVAFVGYGVSAPELGYDDYATVDVDGKVVVYVSGAPPEFPSNERAYYSSGATKVAEAVERGAIGVLTMWSPADVRFRWDVNYARSQRGSFAWLDDQGNPSRGGGPIRGTASLNHGAAEMLFQGAEASREEVFEAAAASTPQGFDLATTVSIGTATTHTTVQSHNVVARLEGSDPELRDEHVVYVAHIDHFGVGVEVDGDDIYNGAHDNASGVSIVMEIARAFESLPTAPRRSVLFLIVTAEEWGLLGADYFVRNPTLDGSLVTAFSLDMPFLFHDLLDIVPYGSEHSSLGASVTAAADHMGIGIGPDPIPEQVLFIRSDHFAFIRQGIPALFLKSGFETGDPSLDGGAINSAFRTERYHTPFDEVDQGFDYEAGADHARVNFLTGYIVAQETPAPTWNEGDFFGGLFGGR